MGREIKKKRERAGIVTTSHRQHMPIEKQAGYLMTQIIYLPKMMIMVITQALSDTVCTNRHRILCTQVANGYSRFFPLRAQHHHLYDDLSPKAEIT